MKNRKHPTSQPNRNTRTKHPIRFSELFPIVLFALSWMGLIALTYYTSGNILDADASNVLVLSNFLAQENAVMSTGWRYYTELHVANMQLVYSLFFRLFDSWRLVRFLGTVTLQLLLVLSYRFFCQQAGISRKAFFYSASVMLLPISVTYARIVLLHGHYAFHISLAFLILGLLLRLSRVPSGKKRSFRILAAVYLFLCFLSGTNGMRQLFISLAPACVLSLCLFLRSDSFSGIARRERSTRTLAVSELYRSAETSMESRAFFLAALGAVANVAGIALNTLVLRKFFGFSTYYSMQTVSVYLENLDAMLNDLLNLFGYRFDARVFSTEGICSLFAVMSFLLAVGLSLWYLNRRDKGVPYAKRFSAAVFLSALTVESFIFLLTFNYFIHYYTPVFILIVPLIANLIDEFPTRCVRLPALCAAVMSFGFFISGFVTSNFLVNRPENYVTEYEGLTYSNIDLVEQIRPAAQYLSDNGYTFGYAYYWDSSVVTELTDGRVEVCALDETPSDITYSYANTKKAFWDIDYHQGKTFALFETKDTDWQSYPIFAGGNEVYCDDYYRIIEYPAPLPFERSPFAE